MKTFKNIDHPDDPSKLYEEAYDIVRSSKAPSVLMLNEGLFGKISSFRAGVGAEFRSPVPAPLVPFVLIENRVSSSNGMPRIVRHHVYPLVVGEWKIVDKHAMRQPVKHMGERSWHIPSPFSKTNAVAIRNADGEYLWVYNGRSWGLPKGYPSYKSFNDAFDMAMQVATPGKSCEIGIVARTGAETALEAAIREVKEETALVISPDVVEDIGEMNKGNAFSHVTTITPKQHFKLLIDAPIDIEIQEMKWSKVAPHGLNPISEWVVGKLGIMAE